MEIKKLFTAYPKVIHQIYHDYVPEKEIAHLNRTQVTTLIILLSTECTSMSVISNHLNLKKGSFTTVTDSLVKLGYINKLRDKTDKRSFNLLLTEEGRRIANLHMLNAKRHLDKKFSKLENSSYTRFINALNDLYEISQELKEIK